jgi:hypothetical protein
MIECLKYASSGNVPIGALRVLTFQCVNVPLPKVQKSSGIKKDLVSQDKRDKCRRSFEDVFELVSYSQEHGVAQWRGPWLVVWATG